MNHLIGRKPKTIDELKEYCERKGFTSEKTRFFIGENYKGPRAFGIYKDETSGEFIVYKNRVDGTRAIRYRGSDEAFAVGELYDKLHAEMASKSFLRKFSPFFEKFKRFIGKLVFFILFVIVLFYCMTKSGLSPDGSLYGSDNYYYDSNSWGYDSWGSGSWDSGYTDWGSDW